VVRRATSGATTDEGVAGQSRGFGLVRGIGRWRSVQAVEEVCLGHVPGWRRRKLKTTPWALCDWSPRVKDLLLVVGVRKVT
jgi:hypothetical protein